jgi:hypothetical protein
VFGAPLGSAIAGHAPFAGAAFTIAWTVVRWLLTIIAVSLLLSVYYFVGANRESPALALGQPGPAWSERWSSSPPLSASFYVAKFGHYGKTFGASLGWPS